MSENENGRLLTLIDQLATLVVALSPDHAESTLVRKARDIFAAAKRAREAAEAGYEKALGLVAEAIGKRWPGALVVSDKDARPDGRIMRLGDSMGRDLHVCFLPADSLHAAHIWAIQAMQPIEDSGADILTIVHSVEATREHFPHLRPPMCVKGEPS